MSETAPPARPAKPRASRWPYLLPLVVVLALGGIFAKRLLDVEHGIDPSLIPPVVINTPAPSFDLPPLPGRGEALRSEALKGKVTLVNFWGSWCVACAVEHPVLMEIAKSGVVTIEGVDWRDAPDKGLAWLKQRGDPYDKVGQDPASVAAIDFGVAQAPESFLIDGNGVIRYKQNGPITAADWQNKIKPLVAELKE